MKKKIMILVIVILVVLVGVGVYKYVYVPKGEIYDIKFLNLKKTNVIGDASEEKGELSDYGLHTRLKFVNVKDSITYTFDITNDGTIKGKLVNDPIIFGTDAYFKKHIYYELTDINGDKINKGDIIEPGDTKKVKLTVTYQSVPDIATQDSSNFEVSIYFLYLENR